MALIKRLLAYLVLIVVLVFGVLFSVQNTTTVAIDLLFVQLPEWRLSLWILLAFAAGGLIGMLISSMAIIRLKTQYRLQRRKLERSEKELDKLRVSVLS